MVFLQTRNSPLTRSLVAPAISRRLLSSRPNILPKNGSTNISKVAIAAGCFLVGGAATVATVVVCEQDRMERWNDRWATGNVVRTLGCASIVHKRTCFLTYEYVCNCSIIQLLLLSVVEASFDTQLVQHMNSPSIVHDRYQYYRG